jgi:hypothetical protein
MAFFCPVTYPLNGKKESLGRAGTAADGKIPADEAKEAS